MHTEQLVAETTLITYKLYEEQDARPKTGM